MRGILKAVAYQPGWTDRGRRVRGPDEDAFSMAATAIERAVPGHAATESRWTVRVTGPVLANVSDGFSAVLGGPVELHEGPLGLGGLAEEISQAVHGNGPQLVVAVDLDPDASGAGSARVVLPTEGAVAFLVDEAPEGSPPPVDLGPLPPGAYVVPRLAAVHRVQGAASPLRWVGDWDAALGKGRPAGRWGDITTDPPPVRVSEGAYLPKPRYREGRASRWRLVADHCTACGAVSFPSRGRCRQCLRGDRLEPHPLPLDGATVLATTWIGRGGQPTEFDAAVEASGPYGVVIVELEPGVRATLPVADAAPGEIRINDRVGTRLRRLYAIDGEWRYGRKAVPLGSPDGPGPS
ncbi:MAG: Zn-ribbon domain-containing OB-fold protein [Thermoplasmata archaeon]